jgi:hypothetical protein
MSDTCKTKTEKVPFKERLKTWAFWKPLFFITIGGLGGFLYYYYIGCASGTCAITSNPYASIAFGGFFGYFIVNRPCGC